MNGASAVAILGAWVILAFSSCSTEFVSHSETGLSSDQIEHELLAHKEEFRSCYEDRQVPPHSKPVGQVTAAFEIGDQGQVTRSSIRSSSLNQPKIEDCLTSVIRGIRFPVPKIEGPISVTYPFKFSGSNN